MIGTVEINNWLKDFKGSTEYALIYNKYFKNPRSVRIVESDFYAISSGKVSTYDEFIKKYSKDIKVWLAFMLKVG